VVSENEGSTYLGRLEATLWQMLPSNILIGVDCSRVLVITRGVGVGLVIGNIYVSPKTCNDAVGRLIGNHAHMGRAAARAW
jgi:hypothetical protein